MTDNTTRTWVADLLTAFAGQKNTLTIPRPYIDLTGSLDAALLLSQIVYWTDRATMDDGWFAKSYPEWEDELTLSEYQVRKAVKVLKPAGVVTDLKKFNGAPTLHYRLDKAMFSEWILKKLQNGNLKNFTIHAEKTSLSSTELTSEPTAEQIIQSPPASVPETPILKTDAPETPVVEESAPSNADASTVDRQELDWATANYFDLEVPDSQSPPTRWSHLRKLCNFFRGTIKDKKGNGEWYDYQFADDPMTPHEILGMMSWWEDKYPEANLPQKPALIREHAAMFRLHKHYTRYLNAGTIYFAQKRKELEPPQPEPEYASAEEIADVLDFLGQPSHD